MSPKKQILTSIAFCLSCLLTGTGATLQPELEEVSLSGVYGFFTNELVIRKFYVALILQVVKIVKGQISNVRVLADIH